MLVPVLLGRAQLPLSQLQPRARERGRLVHAAAAAHLVRVRVRVRVGVRVGVRVRVRVRVRVSPVASSSLEVLVSCSV